MILLHSGINQWPVFVHGWMGISCPNDMCGGCLHLVSPRCPSCMSFSMSSCFLLGMTILVPFNIKTIFYCQSFVESPEWLDLTWNFYNTA